MKILTALLLGGTAVALYGCSPNTPGGPGTALPESEKPMMGQTDNTFSLDVPMMVTKLEQGAVDTVTIGIKRGTNFDQDVSLTLTDVPSGITIDPSNPRIPRTDESAELTVRAAANAGLGDFKVKIAGHPDSGADAHAEFTITVSKHDVEESAGIESDAAMTDRDAKIQAMRDELHALNEKYEELKIRAANATADAKIALDRLVADARVKLDAAEANLEEAKDAAPDRWEKIKEGFTGAVDELKSMFE